MTRTTSRYKEMIRKRTPRQLKELYRFLFPRSMQEAFTDVYGRDDWDGGSGRGSTPENTVEYRKVIEEFLRTHEITSVVDIGCGDWQFSRLIDWGNISYVGIDTVPAVVEANRRRFGPRFEFECIDVTRDALPHGDLVIMKDVLQHWPNDTIRSFLPRLDQYRYAILTNCAYASPELNKDVAMTGYRPIDLRLVPFNYASEELLRYATDEVPGGEWKKLVLLHRSYTKELAAPPA